MIRGGYGIFHDVSHLGVSGGIQQNPPYTNTYTFTTNDITPARTIISGSPINGFPSNSAPQNPATYVGSLAANDKNFKQGIVQQYNLNIQQGLGAGTVFTLAYAGRLTATAWITTQAGTSQLPDRATILQPERPFPQYQTITVRRREWLGTLQLDAGQDRAPYTRALPAGFVHIRRFDRKWLFRGRGWNRRRHLLPPHPGGQCCSLRRRRNNAC